METYQKIILVILILLILSSLVFFFKKNDKDTKNIQDKDRNLKIVVNLIKKENYEDTATGNNSSLDVERCNKILSLLGDSNTKGLNNMYEDITGKSTPLKLPINCSKVNINDIAENMLTMITEMSFNAIENKDKEKGYNDLVALFLFVLKKLVPEPDREKLNVLYDSNGKIDSIEMTNNGTPITPAKFVISIESNPQIEPQGRTPEITNILKKTKERAKMSINRSDLDRFRGDNNSKIKVYDFGIMLSHVLANQGTLIK